MEGAIASSKVIDGSAGAISKLPSSSATISVEGAIALSKVIVGSAGAISKLPSSGATISVEGLLSVTIACSAETTIA